MHLNETIVKATCKWSCNDASKTIVENRKFEHLLPNLILKKINFSSFNWKVNSYYNRKTSVTGRKFHLLEMKIDVKASIFSFSINAVFALLRIQVQIILFEWFTKGFK